LLIAPPSFGSYEIFAELTKTEIVTVPRNAAKHIDQPALLERLGVGDIDLIMLASPNNPTGECLSIEFIEALLAATDALVLLDQAYIEFAASSKDASHLLSEHPNLVILRTFSKAFGLAGIRLGYLLATPEVILELCKVRQPYSVDLFSALLGEAVLDTSEVMRERAAITASQRDRLALALSELAGVKVYASEANFLLVQLAHAADVWQQLYQDHGILLRDFSRSPGLSDCLRISVGTVAENDKLLEALRCVIA
jgi:histidinol-phosphate aminotransferase